MSASYRPPPLAGLAFASVVATSAFAQEPTVIPEITVEAPRADGAERTTAGPVRGYQAETASSATRSDTPIERIPQSVQVVPRRLMEETGAVTQSEAMRNVSGVVPLNTMSIGQMFPLVRGFAADRVVDGLPSYYDPGARDMTANVERIEVLKGPSAILFPGAANAISGLVNVVSKMPTATPHLMSGVTFGGYAMVSPFFDLNTPLNQEGTILFRVTGQYEKTGSQVENYQRRSYSFNPTLTFTNNETTSLTIQGQISRRQHRDYSGLPAVGTLDSSAFSIRSNLWPSTTNLPESSSEVQGLTIRFDHKFNETWSTFTTARISSSFLNEPAQFAYPTNTPTQAPSTFTVMNALLQTRTTQVSANSNLVASFDAGATRNRLLFSVDYDRVTDNSRLGVDSAGATQVDFSAANPTFPAYVEPTVFGLDARNVYTTNGASVQLQTSVWDRLHLVGALRAAHVQVLNHDLANQTSTSNSTTKLLPRLGAAFDIVRGFTVFASYAEGLRAVPVFSGTALKPEESRQWEAGVKLNLARSLTATFAVFDLVRRNVAVSDPNNAFQSISIGEQRSQGFEADVLWQPTPNWSFLIAYAHTYARVTKDTTIPVGTTLTDVPRDAARFWATYRVLDGPLSGMTLGGGLHAQTATRISLSEQYFAPGFVTFDARVSYTYRNWTLALTGKNLADRRYFVRYPYFGGSVAPAEGRTVMMTLSTKL